LKVELFSIYLKYLYSKLTLLQATSVVVSVQNVTQIYRSF